jgi:Asp-tRNA(Asn)/Glu-tRNA(Gln) amidotransferase A subunit family amidase
VERLYLREELRELEARYEHLVYTEDVLSHETCFKLGDGEVDRLIGWCLTYPLNFSGNPAASIPAGLSSGGLPVGMQIIGRRYADCDVLAASAAFEKARPWAHIYERCKGRKI